MHVVARSFSPFILCTVPFWLSHSSFIQSPVNRYLVCFQVFPGDSAARIILVHITWGTGTGASPGHILKSKILGHSMKLEVYKQGHTVFQRTN